MKMNLCREYDPENSFKEILYVYSTEGWALDKSGRRYQVGYICEIWWIGEGGLGLIESIALKSISKKTFCLSPVFVLKKI